MLLLSLSASTFSTSCQTCLALDKPASLAKGGSGVGWGRVKQTFLPGAPDGNSRHACSKCLVPAALSVLGRATAITILLS